MTKYQIDRFGYAFETKKCSLYALEDGSYSLQDGCYIVAHYCDFEDMMENLCLTKGEVKELEESGCL